MSHTTCHTHIPSSWLFVCSSDDGGGSIWTEKCLHHLIRLSVERTLVLHFIVDSTLEGEERTLWLHERDGLNYYRRSRSFVKKFLKVSLTILLIYPLPTYSIIFKGLLWERFQKICVVMTTENTLVRSCTFMWFPFDNIYFLRIPVRRKSFLYLRTKYV